jgi:hypothetical protein
MRAHTHIHTHTQAEEESIVNRLQRQLEGLLHNLRLIEQKLGSKGLNFEDLGILPSELALTE